MADEDGLGTISYRWTRDAFTISGATNSTYTLVQADVGAVIRVVAEYTDDQGNNHISISAATNAVANVNDAPVVSITGTVTEDQVLTAVVTDEDGISGAITYQWTRDGGAINGATSATYTLVQADVGAVIAVGVGYTDDLNNIHTGTSADTSAVANVNDAPTGSVTISGTPTEDQVLTAANTLADEDVLGGISYQWTRDGGAIGGATNATYTLVQADVGAVIAVVASYTDGQGTAETSTSANTSVIGNVNSVPTGSVTISGTETEDQNLTAANNLADEDGLGVISYQWQRGGVNIGGTTPNVAIGVTLENTGDAQFAGIITSKNLVATESVGIGTDTLNPNFALEVTGDTNVEGNLTINENTVPTLAMVIALGGL